MTNGPNDQKGGTRALRVTGELLARRRTLALECRSKFLSISDATEFIKKEMGLTHYPDNMYRQDVRIAAEEAQKARGTDTTMLREIEAEHLNAISAGCRKGIEAGNASALTIALTASRQRAQLLGLNASVDERAREMLRLEAQGILNRLRGQLDPDTYRQVVEVLGVEVPDIEDHEFYLESGTEQEPTQDLYPPATSVIDVESETT